MIDYSRHISAPVKEDFVVLYGEPNCSHVHVYQGIHENYLRKGNFVTCTFSLKRYLLSIS
jgi:predicted nucleic acid-binding Zn finger protein